MVAVTIERIAALTSCANGDEPPRVEDWVDRLVFDSSILARGRVVKGTGLSAEALVSELADGSSDRELLAARPELTAEDVVALRQYARLPEAFRLTFGAWAEDEEKFDRYLDLLRGRRKLGRREIAP